MHPPEVFLERAVECEHMAESTRDAGSRAAWRGMAERWQRCAQTATNASVEAARQASKQTRHRRRSPGWARQ
jgi:hypothetical protein